MPDKNVALPDGRVVAFPDSMDDAAISAVLKKQFPPKTSPNATLTLPSMGSNPSFSVEMPQGQAQTLSNVAQGAGSAALTGIGAAALPEAIPAAEALGGSGLLGFMGRVLAKAGLSGVGAGAGKMVSEATTGDNPISGQHLKETAQLAGWTSLLSAPFEMLGEIPTTKLGRSLINKSMGVAKRELSYGDPSKAIIDENISHLSNGNWGAVLDAKQAGKSLNEATAAAGGKIAAVNQRINEVTPLLNSLLNSSQATVPIHVIEDPITSIAVKDVMNNRALSFQDKADILGKLSDLRDSLTKGLPSDVPVMKLQAIKQDIGNTENWGRAIEVKSTTEQIIKDAKRQVYGSIAEGIHQAVPESRPLDARLTNLLAASDSLGEVVKDEQRSNIPFSVSNLTAKEAGRAVPKLPAAAQIAVPAGATIAQQLQSKGMLPQPEDLVPALPFRPGAGVPKPKTNP